MSNAARDQEKARAVFREVVTRLEKGDFTYAVGGGLCTDHWRGGAKRIGDIDVVIREEDSAAILEDLAGAGYETTEMDGSWLHKAFKDGVTVDLMFELKNGTRLDDAFAQHRRREELFGSMAYVMAPEDQVASLTGTVDRETIGNHWYGIMDLMSNNDLDWDYLVTRCHRIPLKMLAVVHYATSERIPVPKGVIGELERLGATAEV